MSWEHAPWFAALWGEGRAGALGWGLGRETSINYSHGPVRIKQKVG